jgi:DNA-binding NtrC family response regulator
MVATRDRTSKPFEVVLTGEAEHWLPALRQIVGPETLIGRKVEGDGELIRVVESGGVDAAVLDEESHREVPVLHVLRMIRRVDPRLPVVIVSRHNERRWLEDALRLAAFSVLNKPLQFEPLLRQIWRMMDREMARQARRRGGEGRP